MTAQKLADTLVKTGYDVQLRGDTYLVRNPRKAGTGTADLGRFLSVAATEKRREFDFSGRTEEEYEGEEAVAIYYDLEGVEVPYSVMQRWARIPATA